MEAQKVQIIGVVVVQEVDGGEDALHIQQVQEVPDLFIKHLIHSVLHHQIII